MDGVLHRDDTKDQVGVMSWKTFVAVLLIPSIALAAEPPYTLPPLVPDLKVELSSIPAGEDHIVSVTKGAPAPFSGQLFSNETALRWGNWLEQYRLQVPMLLQTQERVCFTEIKYRDDVLRVKEDAAAIIQDDMMERLERLEERNTELQTQLNKGPEWYRSRTFGIVIGAVGALGFTALSIWAIDASKK